MLATIISFITITFIVGIIFYYVNSMDVKTDRKNGKQQRMSQYSISRIILSVANIIILLLLIGLIVYIIDIVFSENKNKVNLSDFMEISTLLTVIPAALVAFCFKILTSGMALLSIWLLANWISRILTSYEYFAPDMKKPIYSFASRVTNFVIKTAAIFISLLLFGVNLWILTGVLGFVILIIGLLYYTKIISMFAGLHIAKDPPFEIGDTIKINESEFEVLAFSLTHTTLLLDKNEETENTRVFSNTKLLKNIADYVDVKKKVEEKQENNF